MNIVSLVREVQHFGIVNAIRSTTIRIANRAGAIRVLRALAIEQADPSFTQLDARYEHGFLEADALRRFARDPAYDLKTAQIEAALARGDRCYAILERGTPAIFEWYATRPTAISDELVLRFDHWHACMYERFTHPAHRGKRLHAIGMTLALTRLRAEGYAGVVSCIDAADLGALRSYRRVGYRDVGMLCIAKLGRRYVVGTIGSLARYGVAIEPAPSTKDGARVAVEAH